MTLPHMARRVASHILGTAQGDVLLLAVVRCSDKRCVTSHMLVNAVGDALSWTVVRTLAYAGTG